MSRIDRDKYDSLCDIRKLSLELVQAIHSEKEEFHSDEASEAHELLVESLDEYEENFGEDDEEEEENDDE